MRPSIVSSLSVAGTSIVMMGNNMKWVVATLCWVNLAAAAELSTGRTVFLMPMSHGLDQFVASRLTRMGVLRVVTDPAKADTIITDQVGSGFEARMSDLYPPPPAPDSKDAAKDASPDAETGKVIRLSVWKTLRSSSCTSPIMCVNQGSTCPTIGVARAR